MVVVVFFVYVACLFREVLVSLVRTYFLGGSL